VGSRRTRKEQLEHGQTARPDVTVRIGSRTIGKKGMRSKLHPPVEGPFPSSEVPDAKGIVDRLKAEGVLAWRTTAQLGCMLQIVRV